MLFRRLWKQNVAAEPKVSLPASFPSGGKTFFQDELRVRTLVTIAGYPRAQILIFRPVDDPIPRLNVPSVRLPLLLLLFYGYFDFIPSICLPWKSHQSPVPLSLAISSLIFYQVASSFLVAVSVNRDSCIAMDQSISTFIYADFKEIRAR